MNSKERIFLEIIEREVGCWPLFNFPKDVTLVKEALPKSELHWLRHPS